MEDRCAIRYELSLWLVVPLPQVVISFGSASLTGLGAITQAAFAIQLLLTVFVPIPYQHLINCPCFLGL
jgi:hypothetical protein